MAFYKKKPVIIEAIQWTGDNIKEIEKFCLGNAFFDVIGYKNDEIAEIYELTISTLEGTMISLVGDFIIKGIKGEFYPCKADIFEQSYEIVSE